MGLEYLNPDGGAMPSSQVAFVLNLADVKDQERIKKEDIQAVLGLWRTTYKEMPRIRQAIGKLETKPDGKLSTEQVESILKTANGDKDCQSTDLEFVLGTVPHGKTLGLSPDELMLAIPNWYCHVENYYIKTRSGWKLAIPFLYVMVVTSGACVVTAATTLLFSEAKTQDFLLSTLQGYAISNFLTQPLNICTGLLGWPPNAACIKACFGFVPEPKKINIDIDDEGYVGVASNGIEIDPLVGPVDGGGDDVGGDDGFVLG